MAKRDRARSGLIGYVFIALEASSSEAAEAEEESKKHKRASKARQMWAACSAVSL